MNSSSSFIFSTDEAPLITAVDTSMDSENPLLPKAPKPRTLPKSASSMECPSHSPPSSWLPKQSSPQVLRSTGPNYVASDPHLDCCHYTMHERHIRCEEHFGRDRELVNRIQTTSERIYSGYYWTRSASMSRFPDAMPINTAQWNTFQQRVHTPRSPGISETRENFTNPNKIIPASHGACFKDEKPADKPYDQNHVSRMDQFSGDRDKLPQMVRPCHLSNCPTQTYKSLGNGKSDICFTRRNGFEPPVCMMRGRPCRPCRSQSAPNRTSTGETLNCDSFATTYIYNPRSDSSGSFEKKTGGPFPGDYEEFRPFQSNISFHGSAPRISQPYEPPCSGKVCGFRYSPGRSYVPLSPTDTNSRKSHFCKLHGGRSNLPDRFRPLSSQRRLSTEKDSRVVRHPSLREIRESSWGILRPAMPVTPKRSPRKVSETAKTTPKRIIQPEKDEYQKDECLTPNNLESLREDHTPGRSNKTVTELPGQLFSAVTSYGQEKEAWSHDQIQSKQQSLFEQSANITKAPEILAAYPAERVQLRFSNSDRLKSHSSVNSKEHDGIQQTIPEQQPQDDLGLNPAQHLDYASTKCRNTFDTLMNDVLSERGSPLEKNSLIVTNKAARSTESVKSHQTTPKQQPREELGLNPAYHSDSASIKCQKSSDASGTDVRCVTGSATEKLLCFPTCNAIKSSKSFGSHQTIPKQQLQEDPGLSPAYHLISPFINSPNASTGLPSGVPIEKESTTERIASFATIPSTAEPRQSKTEEHSGMSRNLEGLDNLLSELCQFTKDKLPDSDPNLKMPQSSLEGEIPDNENLDERKSERNATSRFLNGTPIPRASCVKLPHLGASPVSSNASTAECRRPPGYADVVPREPPVCPVLEVEELTLSAEPSATERKQNIFPKSNITAENPLGLPESIPSERLSNITGPREGEQAGECSPNLPPGLSPREKYPGLPSANTYRTIGSVRTSPASSQLSFIEGLSVPKQMREPINVWDVDSTPRAIQSSEHGPSASKAQTTTVETNRTGCSEERSTPSTPATYRKIQEQTSGQLLHSSAENNLEAEREEQIILGDNDLKQQAVQNVPLTESKSHKECNMDMKKSAISTNRAHEKTLETGSSSISCLKALESSGCVCTVESNQPQHCICHGSVEARKSSAVSSVHSTEPHVSLTAPTAAKPDDLTREGIPTDAPTQLKQPITLSEHYDNSLPMDLSSVESEKRKKTSVGYALHPFGQLQFLGMIPPLLATYSPSFDLAIDHANQNSDKHDNLRDNNLKPSTVHRTVTSDESGTADNLAPITYDNGEKSTHFTEDSSRSLIDNGIIENPVRHQEEIASTHMDKFLVDEGSSRRSGSRNRQKSFPETESQLSPSAAGQPSADSNTSHISELCEPVMGFFKYSFLDRLPYKPSSAAVDMQSYCPSWKEKPVSKKSYLASQSVFAGLISSQQSGTHHLSDQTGLLSPDRTKELFRQFLLDFQDYPRNTKFQSKCALILTSSCYQSNELLQTEPASPCALIMGNTVNINPISQRWLTLNLGLQDSDCLIASPPNTHKEPSEALSAIIAATVTQIDPVYTRSSQRTTTVPTFDLQNPTEVYNDQVSHQSNIISKDGVPMDDFSHKSPSKEKNKMKLITQNITSTVMENGAPNVPDRNYEQPQPGGESHIRFSSVVKEARAQKMLFSDTTIQYPFHLKTKPIHQVLNQCDTNLDIHHDLEIYSTTSTCCCDRQDPISRMPTDQPTSSHPVGPKCIIDLDADMCSRKNVATSGMKITLGCQQQHQKQQKQQLQGQVQEHDSYLRCPEEPRNERTVFFNRQNQATSSIPDFIVTRECIRQPPNKIVPTFKCDLNYSLKLDASAEATFCNFRDSVKIAYSDIGSRSESGAPFSAPGTQDELVPTENASAVEYGTNEQVSSNKLKYNSDDMECNNSGYTRRPCNTCNSSNHNRIISPHCWDTMPSTYSATNPTEVKHADGTESLGLRYFDETTPGNETTDSAVMDHEYSYSLPQVNSLLDRTQSTPPRRVNSDLRNVHNKRPEARVGSPQTNSTFYNMKELVQHRRSIFQFGKPTSLLNKLLLDKERFLRQCLRDTQLKTGDNVWNYTSVKNALRKGHRLNGDRNLEWEKAGHPNTEVYLSQSSDIYADRTYGTYRPSAQAEIEVNNHRTRQCKQNSNYPKLSTQTPHSPGFIGPVGLYFDKDAIFVRGETRDDEKKPPDGIVYQAKHSFELKNSRDVTYAESTCPTYMSTPRHVHYSPAIHGTVKEMVYNSNKITPEAQEILLVMKHTIKMIMQDLAALNGQMLDRNFRACEAISEHLVQLPEMLNALLDHLRYSPVEYELVHLVTVLNGLITEVATDPVIVLFHLIELGYRLNELANILGEDLVPNDMPLLVHAVQSKLHVSKTW
ncbi:hypothetical protein FBUS_09491 [Fasciolopsis buskii]|uniref:Uncharacterized protein n=1 Tax=Fasciolopsis buskii TaxID=27845 RepID=A0A8E0RYJ3_9TREM|nr:hypothetical protein FBUS_09491 [Fasciolopsis buski]